VNHYDGRLFLSMVDCGPSRFAIWRRFQSESAEKIVAKLRSVVIERGPCEELLLDNSMTFRSASVEEFADEWGISLRFRAAYALRGNGNVERNHRTIKRIAESGVISSEEAIFWYNVTPGRMRIKVQYLLTYSFDTLGGYHLTLIRQKLVSVVMVISPLAMKFG